MFNFSIFVDSTVLGALNSIHRESLSGGLPSYIHSQRTDWMHRVSPKNPISTPPPPTSRRDRMGRETLSGLSIPNRAIADCNGRRLKTSVMRASRENLSYMSTSNPIPCMFCNILYNVQSLFLHKSWKMFFTLLTLWFELKDWDSRVFGRQFGIRTFTVVEDVTKLW